MTRVLILFITVFVSIVPLGVLALYSVAPGWRFPDLWPSSFDIQAWEYLFSRGGEVSSHMLSSVGYSLATVGCSFAMTISAAHALAFSRFQGKAFVEGILLAPALVPPMTFSMGVHYMFIKLGLVDSFVGVVLVLTVFSYPYMLRALVAGYQSIGVGYAECARNLGADSWTVFFRVELPLLLPAIAAGSSVVFLVAFSEYFLVFLIGGGVVDSFTGYLFPFLASSSRNYGSMLSLVFLIVPVLLFLMLEFVLARVLRYRFAGAR